MQETLTIKRKIFPTLIVEVVEQIVNENGVTTESFYSTKTETFKFKKEGRYEEKDQLSYLKKHIANDSEIMSRTAYSGGAPFLPLVARTEYYRQMVIRSEISHTEEIVDDREKFGHENSVSRKQLASSPIIYTQGKIFTIKEILDRRKSFILDLHCHESPVTKDLEDIYLKKFNYPKINFAIDPELPLLNNENLATKCILVPAFGGISVRVYLFNESDKIFSLNEPDPKNYPF